MNVGFTGSVMHCVKYSSITMTELLRHWEQLLGFWIWPYSDIQKRTDFGNRICVHP